VEITTHIISIFSAT